MKVTIRDGISNYIEDNYPEYINDILLADGFEEAFIGVAESFDDAPRACYDSAKCIDILIKRDGMDCGEAVEYFEFNVRGAYLGEYTPVFIFPFDKEYDCISISA
jgi:hypothetical protein